MIVLTLLKTGFRGLGRLLVYSSTWQTWQLLLVGGLLYLATNFQFGKQPQTSQAETNQQNARIDILTTSIATHVSNADSAEIVRKKLTQAVYALPADSLQYVLDSLYAVGDGRPGFTPVPANPPERKPGAKGHQ